MRNDGPHHAGRPTRQVMPALAVPWGAVQVMLAEACRSAAETRANMPHLPGWLRRLAEAAATPASLIERPR